MAQPRISLCTYVYNDADYAAELVRLADDFTLTPDEIVVVDDGSTTPFLMEDAPSKLKVVRFDANQGITGAKGAGLSAATGDVILSMDCDTRIERDWLEKLLPKVLEPSVGLVGGALRHRSGDGLVSRYLERFGDNHNQRHIGPVDFIPGNAFLLRRETWERAGGFSGYNETNCQDHYLCHRLRGLGMTLYSDARAKAWQLRRIDRAAMCKRVWKWCHKPIKRQAAEVDDAPTYLFGILAAPMVDRLTLIGDLGEPLFIYLELLYLAHAILDTLDHLAAIGHTAPALRTDFLAALGALFAGHGRISALFRADLLSMGHGALDLRSGDPVAWEDFFVFAPALRQGGVMAWLDGAGVRLLMEDEAAETYDFSSYAEASFAM